MHTKTLSQLEDLAQQLNKLVHSLRTNSKEISINITKTNTLVMDGGQDKAKKFVAVLEQVHNTGRPVPRDEFKSILIQNHIKSVGPFFGPKRSLQYVQMGEQLCVVLTADGYKKLKSSWAPSEKRMLVKEDLIANHH